MPDAFGFTGIFMIFLVYAMLLLPIFLLGLAVPYMVLRQRDTASPQRDPQVGIKAALYYFFSVGILLALNGVTIIVVDLLVEKQGPGMPFGVPARGDETFPNTAQRNGLGLIISGVLFTLFHLVLLKAMTNDRISVAPRRIFVGWRFAIHGGIVMAAFTALVMVLVQKDPGDKNARNALFGVLVVWVPSWLIHLAILRVYSREPRRHPVAEVTPPWVEEA